MTHEPTQSIIQPLDKGIAKLWAREKISTLLDEKIRGRNHNEVRHAVLQVALQHQLVSPYTSLVAVENVISRPTSDTLKAEAIPNLAPKGQQIYTAVIAKRAVSYPRTATNAPLHLLLGLLSLLAMLCLQRPWQRVFRRLVYTVTHNSATTTPH